MSRVRIRIGAVCADGNVGEISVFGRTGKARNTLVFSVISHFCRIGFEGNVLVVVHIDGIAAIAINGDGRILVGHGGIPVNTLRKIRRLHLGTPRSALRFRVGNLLFGTIQVVVHRVFNGILLVPEDDIVIAASESFLNMTGAPICKVIAVNGLRICGSRPALLAVLGNRVSKLRLGAFFKIFNLVGKKLLPVCRDGHIACGHSEGIAALKRGGIGQALDGPTSEFVSHASGLALHRLRRTFLGNIRGCIGIVPRTASKVIGNLETAHVLSIEVRRAVNRIRERCRLREALVQIPAREGVGYAINRLGFRELLIHHIGRLGGVTRNVVFSSLLLKLRAARITQVILH